MTGWTSPVVITPPVGDVVTLADAQAHCVSGDDPLVALYRDAAVGLVEAWTGTRLLTQTVRMQRANLDCRMSLPIGPVQSATIAYLDSAGASQALDTSLFALTGADTLAPGFSLLRGKSWPSLYGHPAAITLTAVVGYGAAAQVPAPIRQAILLLIGDWYMNREDTIAERSVTPATLPNGVSALLANFRVF